LARNGHVTAMRGVIHALAAIPAAVDRRRLP
jgi:hypothetical protein